MKFSSATLALSLVMGALSSSTAFVVPSQIGAPTSAATSLQMVATNEIVNNDTKPKKTREVGKQGSLVAEVQRVMAQLVFFFAGTTPTGV